VTTDRADCMTTHHFHVFADKEIVFIGFESHGFLPELFLVLIIIMISYASLASQDRNIFR